MPAYVFANIDVHDDEGYAGYRALSGPSAAKYGGKFIVRGGKHELLEGDWKGQRIAVLEFENMERAREWYNSPEYREAIAIRHEFATTNFMILVEGV